MTHWRMRIAGVIGVTALALAGCADNTDEAEAEEPQSAPEESESAAPTPKASSAPEEQPQSTGDDWLDGLYEDHLDEIIAWWNIHVDAGCDITEADCADHFSDGAPLLDGYADALADAFTDERDQIPADVTPLHSAKAREVSFLMEAYVTSCPDGVGCDEYSSGVEQEINTLLNETGDWLD